MYNPYSPYATKKPKRKQRRTCVNDDYPGEVISTQEEALARIHTFLTDPRNRLTQLFNMQPILDEVKRTPSSRQKRAIIKIDYSRYEPKYTDAGV